MSNKRHRIAWANDTTKLSNDAVREDQIRYVGSMAEVIYNSERVSIPAAWLRPVEPGHVWVSRAGRAWEPGLISRDKRWVYDADGEYWSISNPIIEIHPAHTTPPDAEFDRDEAISREYTEEMDDRAASSQPTYARRWEELSEKTQKAIYRLVTAYDPDKDDSPEWDAVSHIYEELLYLASLSTLRSADRSNV